MKHIKYLLVLIACITIDQLTKWLVVRYLKGTDGISIIPRVFRLQYLENSGAAFGILQNGFAFLIVIPIVVLALLLFLFFRIPEDRKYVYLKIILTLIVSGAIGNMVDRIIYGYVIDFLYIELINFPIFNFADCFVTISAFLLFFVIMFYYKDEDLEFMKPTKHKEKT